MTLIFDRSPTTQIFAELRFLGTGTKGNAKTTKAKVESEKVENEAETPVEPVQEAESPATDPEAITQQTSETVLQDEDYVDVPVGEDTGDEAEAESATFEHDPVVLELIQGTNDIMAVATELSAQHEEIYFKLGGLLFEAKRNDLHVSMGYEDSANGFNKFASDRAGVGERKGYHLQRIYRTFRMAGISSVDMAGIGWTKSRILASIKAEQLAADRGDILEAARTKTRDELEAHVKTTYEDARSEGDRIQKTTYKFQLYGDANSLVQQALDEAKSRVENNDGNAAFEMICTEWLTLDQGSETETTDAVDRKSNV